MRKLLPLCFGLLAISLSAIGQQNQDNQHTPYIEVDGFAEQTIVPDEIYIAIKIKERESGRDKVSVEQQVTDLQRALASLNIPQENLVTSDSRSDYVKIGWGKMGVISQGDYELKVSTANEVAQVFEKLDELNMDNARISRVSHSKIAEYRKETRVMAIKAAKEKADYLLEAIGQKTGIPLIVKENQALEHNRSNYANVRGSINYPEEIYLNGASKTKQAIRFKKINIQSHIYVKFGIE